MFKSTVSFLFLIAFCSTSISSIALAVPKAKVLKAGKGIISAKTSWKDGFRIPPQGGKKKYDLFWLEENHLPRIPPGIAESWHPSHFTNLSEIPAGTELETFKLVVHALELTVLIPSLAHEIAEASLDLFVHNYLKPAQSYFGIDFIRYYPFFFQKKTIISASVVSENLTATFGKVGLVLNVPGKNYIAASKTDMQTPTDFQFYGFNRAIEMGLNGVKKIARRFPPPPLNDLLPQQPVVTDGKPHQVGKLLQHEEDQEMAALFAMLAREGAFTNKEVTQQALSGEGAISWYNEVAINPLSPIGGEEVVITGIFLSASADPDSKNSLSNLMKRPETIEILKVAQEYDLPVVQIYDGQFYETDVLM